MLMLVSIVHEIPEVITGVTGAVLIGLSLWSSNSYNKQQALLIAPESLKQRYPNLHNNS
jgi:hypothetical protein